MKLLGLILKIFINPIYFFMKFLPTNDKKVVFISRQTNKIPIDYQLLGKEIKKLDDDYKLVFLCNKVKKNIIGMFSYSFLTLKHLYHLATARVCIVDSYCLAVSFPKHKKKLVVIQIWHAIMTVKKFGYQALEKEYGRSKKLATIVRMHQNYDWVISGSYAMRKTFSENFNVPISKVKCTGTPRIDYLIKNIKKKKKKILKRYPSLNHKKIILYAPTFRKDAPITIDKLVSEIDFNKYSLIVKTHPIQEQYFPNEDINKYPDLSTLDCLSIADYVITDYSSVAIESAILNIPTYFYLYDYDEYMHKNGLAIDLYEEMGDVCFESFDKLYETLKSKKYPFDKLKKFKNKYVSNQKGNSGYILANYIVNGEWLDI